MPHGSRQVEALHEKRVGLASQSSAVTAQVTSANSTVTAQQAKNAKLAKDRCAAQADRGASQEAQEPGRLRKAVPGRVYSLVAASANHAMCLLRAAPVMAPTTPKFCTMT